MGGKPAFGRRTIAHHHSTRASSSSFDSRVARSTHPADTTPLNCRSRQTGGPGRPQSYRRGLTVTFVGLRRDQMARANDAAP
jgi:hypothetical protein